MKLLLSLLFTVGIASHATASFQEGDRCGVTSSDFLDFDFGGKFLVAGEAGCTDANGLEGCYCAPDLKDQDSLSEWKWQCNNSVDFGPIEGKVCPATVPVPKGDETITAVTYLRSSDGSNVCDQSIHPTGRPNDPVCPYSDCDSGGDTSAICGCVDLAAYGMGDGVEWVCMHSTCSCGAEEEAGVELQGDEASAAPITAFSPVVAIAASLFLVVVRIM